MRKVKCERTNPADGVALPPCKRCAKADRECELYTNDRRTRTARGSLAAEKIGETSRKRRGQGRAGSAVVDAAQPAVTVLAPAPPPPVGIARAPAPAVDAATNLGVAPLDLQAQPSEVPEVYEPTVLEQQDMQQQQPQQPQQMMQQVCNFAMPATTNPYTRLSMGMSMNVGTAAGWQQTPQLQYQLAFGNAVYTPVSGNIPVGMGFNIDMAQQQMVMPTQQHQQPQYPSALDQQLFPTQQNAWMFAQPQ